MLTAPVVEPQAPVLLLVAFVSKPFGYDGLIRAVERSRPSG